MNSTQAQSKNSQPTLTPAQELAQVRQQLQAVSEMLWEAIATMAPDTYSVTVNPHASNPLWELNFLRAEGQGGKPDPSGKMTICAALIPEITESEKKRIVRLVRGSAIPLQEAITQLKLPHPTSYVEQKIADRVKWDATVNIWSSVTQPTIGEKIKNVLRISK